MFCIPKFNNLLQPVFVLHIALRNSTTIAKSLKQWRDRGKVRTTAGKSLTKV